MNIKLILYALHSIKQRKVKNFVISFTLIILSFTIFSLLMVQSSLNKVLEENIKGMPSITLQKLQGGRIVWIQEDIIDDVLEITGVKDAVSRVWGYYFYELAQVNLILASYDLYEEAGHKNFKNILENEEKEGLIIGKGVEQILMQFRGDAKSMTFLNNSLERFNAPVIRTFKDSNPIFTNDVVLMPKDLAHKILEIPENFATDMAVYVPNPKEINTVISKIKEKHPNLRIITKQTLKSGYEQVLNYKSGLFISMFIIALISFFILVFEKASGLSQDEKSEIATLKAIGWQSGHIIQVKAIENIIISINAFLMGLAFALFFVFILEAPIFKDIFLGFNAFNPAFTLPFSLDFSIIVISFLLSVGIYLAAVLLPTYKCAVIDADEGLR